VSFDSFIVAFDRGLRSVFGATAASRPIPGGDIDEAQMSPEERDEAAALMRVNHCGEVCAQALYQGQALASKDPAIASALTDAAREEEDHLAWTQTRIGQLGGRTSLLNPLWYAGSLAIGFVAGRVGDRWNLGFLQETERQVERHLSGHLERLPKQDLKSRAIVEAMKADEGRHADTAGSLGARPLPLWASRLMRSAAKVMTTLSHRI